MKPIFKRRPGKKISHQNGDNLFPITEGLPQPIPNVKYTDQLRVIKTLDILPVGESFPVMKELVWTVRKMTRIYHPEYKIKVRNLGDSYRVFRIV